MAKTEENLKAATFEPDEVLHAEYDLDGYEGSALVVYRKGYNYYVVEEIHQEGFAEYLRRRIKSERRDSRKNVWKRIIKTMREDV